MLVVFGTGLEGPWPQQNGIREVFHMEKDVAIWKGQNDCVLAVVVYLDSCLRFTQPVEKGPTKLGSTFAEGV